jgi:predicted nucleic acid-binding protein
MTAEFIDTNILVYAHDRSTKDRHDLSVDLIVRLAETGMGVLSTQVLVEFYSVATRKLKMTNEEAEEVLIDFGAWPAHRPAHSDLLRAIDLQRRYKIGWWDALILNSAAEMGAATLWSEDFGDRRRFGPVLVRNPFV